MMAVMALVDRSLVEFAVGRVATLGAGEALRLAQDKQGIAALPF